MPPKKKKGGKKKKGKKKDDATLEQEEKFKKSVAELDSLKDHLAVRKEFTRRSQFESEEWKTQMKEAQEQLTDHRADQRAISADMTRQYKTMQTEMGLQIHQLETELGKTKNELETTKTELKDTKAELERTRNDKDAEIDTLNRRIKNMEESYEKILNNALDSLVEKLEISKQNWEDKSTALQVESKQALFEFGLHPLNL